MKDGWFRSGDLARRDKDGFYYIVDRAKDMIIRGGFNVYPREIEEVLHRHDGVVDCAVFGVPDERYGEQLKAMVEVRPGVTVDDLLSFGREHLANFKVPAIVELVDTLPRDPNGKVLKRLLRDAHWQGRPTAVG
jgi:long-chain acyl-CoA synthetase